MPGKSKTPTFATLLLLSPTSISGNCCHLLSSHEACFLENAGLDMTGNCRLEGSLVQGTRRLEQRKLKRCQFNRKLVALGISIRLCLFFLHLQLPKTFSPSTAKGYYLGQWILSEKELTHESLAQPQFMQRFMQVLLTRVRV